MRTTFASLAVLILAGCGTSVTMTRLQPIHVSTKLPPSSVEVFASGPPRRPYDDVALLQATTGDDDTPEMIRHLQERAAEAGCDAIVLGGFTDHQGGEHASIWRLIDPASTTLTAACIVYRDEEVVLPFRDPRTSRVRPSVASSDGVHQRVDREDPP
jgi:hypothetical protein